MKVRLAVVVLCCCLGVALGLSAPAGAEVAPAAPRPAALPALGALQADCGWWTCTIRFDRAQTKSIRDHLAKVSWLCSSTNPWIKVGCMLLTVRLGIDTGLARRFYGRGNCIGYRFEYAAPAIAWPIEVAHGRYNCR